MRVLNFFNDHVNGAASIIVESNSKLPWDNLEIQMEDMVAEEKRFEAFVERLKTLPDTFKDVKFVKGYAYKKGGSQKTVEETTEPLNEFGLTRRGFKLNNPNETVIEYT